MDPMGQETREKVAHWIQEGIKLFPHLPALLQGDDVAIARAADLERECEKLHREATELRRDLEQLKKEHEQLRADRDEVAQAFAKVMDSVQPMTQIAQKLGVKRSPFDRDPRAAAPAPAPAAQAPKPS